MENYAWRKTVVLQAIVLIGLLGCRTSRTTGGENDKHQNDHGLKDSTMTRINSLLEPLSGFDECGTVNLTSKDLCSFNLNNMEYLKCVRSKRENLELYSDVMSQITKEVKFDNLCYIRYIWHIKSLNDPKSFTTAVELLKNDWQPEYDPNASIYYGPVNEYAHNFLIEPHIKSIDGKTYQEYINEDAANRHFHVISTEEYYQQIKDLWESGRIVLNSEQ